MDSPRAFFQFPIGFSHNGIRRDKHQILGSLSIPYRILTVRVRGHEDRGINFQFPIGFSRTNTKTWGAVYSLSLSIPYRILTWLWERIWNNKLYLSIPYRILTLEQKALQMKMNMSFQFPIGFSHDKTWNEIRSKVYRTFQFPIGFSLKDC